jgi:hypothetical protein
MHTNTHIFIQQFIFILSKSPLTEQMRGGNLCTKNLQKNLVKLAEIYDLCFHHISTLNLFLISFFLLNNHLISFIKLGLCTTNELRKNSFILFFYLNRFRVVCVCVYVCDFILLKQHLIFSLFPIHLQIE